MQKNKVGNTRHTGERSTPPMDRQRGEETSMSWVVLKRKQARGV
jgi:hypothetical protein